MLSRLVRSRLRAAVLSVVAVVVLGAASGCGSSGDDASTAAGGASTTKGQSATGAAALLPQSVKDRGYLNVSGPDGSPPLSQKNGNQAEGMDPDLMSALGDVLGVKVRFSAVPFDSQLPGMAAGKYDLSTGEFYVTAERIKTADFISAWRDYSSFLSKKDDSFAPKTNADLCGHKIGVLKGSAEEATLSDYNKKSCSPKMAISSFPDQNASFLALSSGRVDAVTTGRELLELAVQNSPGKFKISGEFGGGPTAVAIARNANSAQMIKAVEAGFKELMASGKYQEILKKWRTDYGAVKAPTTYTQGSTLPTYG